MKHTYVRPFAFIFTSLAMSLCACQGTMEGGDDALRPGAESPADFAADAGSTCDGSSSSDHSAEPAEPPPEHTDAPAEIDDSDSADSADDAPSETDEPPAEDPSEAEPDPDYCTHSLESRPSQMVDLADEGLQPGDDLSPWLDQYWEQGWEVHVPGGDYELSDPDSLGIDASEDSWLIGDGEVVVDHGDQHVEFNLEADGAVHVRMQNFTLRGTDTGDDSKVRPYTRDEDGLVELININRPDGTFDGEEGTGFYIPRQHAGTTRFINCHVEGFTDNGIYGSSPGQNDGGGGHIEVLGGLYKNNNVSGVRVGGDHCKVIGAAIVNDATGGSTDGGPGVQRGIRVREEGEDILIEDCDITHLDEPGVAEPIEIRDGKFDGVDGTEEVIVRNVRIRNETDNPAVNTDADDYPAYGSGIHLTGEGSHELEGTGPYDDVVEGAAADPPVTQKRWACPGRHPQP